MLASDLNYNCAAVLNSKRKIGQSLKQEMEEPDEAAAAAVRLLLVTGWMTVPVLPAAWPPGVFRSLIVICVSRQCPAYNHQL